MSRTIEVPEYEVHDEVRVDPARTALVVVDMQNDFVREGGSLRGPDAEATIPAATTRTERSGTRTRCRLDLDPDDSLPSTRASAGACLRGQRRDDDGVEGRRNRGPPAPTV